MKEVIYNGKKIELWDNTAELPHQRFSLFNRMILIDSEVGADLESLDGHIARASHFIKDGDNEKAAKIMDNLRQCFYLIMSDVNPELKAFACLVKSIDGKTYNLTTEEEVDKIYKELKEKVPMPIGLIKITIEAIKKKLRRN